MKKPKLTEEEKRLRRGEYNKKYRQGHAEYYRQWRKQHREEINEKERLRRAKKKIPKVPAWMIYLPPDVVETAKCRICGRELPLIDTFFKYIDKDQKWQTSCITCADKRREQKRKELERKRSNKPPAPPPLTPEERKERERERSRRWYLENREKKLEQGRLRRQTPEGKAVRKAYMQSLKGRELKARNRKAWKQSRRAREKGLESSFTIKQWEDVKSFFKGRCAYCGQETELTMDHFIAVANGGEYSRDNILPACFSCNSDKSAHDFFEWYPEKPFYSQTRERFLLKYLNYKGVGVQQRTLLG